MPLSFPIFDGTLPFSQYLAQTRVMIGSRRTDLAHDAEHIISVNSPFELRPENYTPGNKTKIGVVMSHGLLDCPFSTRDIALRLQTQGILCRSILLPGHGTIPSDLLHISYQDWIQAMRYAIETMSQEVEQIFIVGYSTGAALAIYHAIQNPKIAGIILFAPAVRIRKSLDAAINWYHSTRWFYKNSQWLRREKEVDYAKYRSVAFHPVYQVHTLTNVLADLCKQQMPTCPMLMIVSEDDETISSEDAINFFTNTKHPDSKLILYNENNSTTILDPRVITRNSCYPDLQIKNFSHVTIPFAPNNMHYGQKGDYVFASHPNTKKYTYCGYNHALEKTYQTLYKLRLIKRMPHEVTYNPDFDFMADNVAQFILSKK